MMQRKPSIWAMPSHLTYAAGAVLSLSLVALAGCHEDRRIHYYGHDYDVVPAPAYGRVAVLPPPPVYCAPPVVIRPPLVHRVAPPRGWYGYGRDRSGGSAHGRDRDRGHDRD